MYLPNQVIWDADNLRPYQMGSDVWDLDNYPAVSTHLVWVETGEVATPKNVEDAQRLLDIGLIAPSTPPPDRIAKIKALIDFDASEDELNYAYWKHSPWRPQDAAAWLQEQADNNAVVKEEEDNQPKAFQNAWREAQLHAAIVSSNRRGY